MRLQRISLSESLSTGKRGMDRDDRENFFTSSSVGSNREIELSNQGNAIVNRSDQMRPNALLIVDESQGYRMIVCGLSVFVRMVCALERSTATVFVSNDGLSESTRREFEADLARHSKNPRVTWLDKRSSPPTDLGLIVASAPGVFDPRAFAQESLDNVDQSVVSIAAEREPSWLWMLSPESALELVDQLKGKLLRQDVEEFLNQQSDTVINPKGLFRCPVADEDGRTQAREQVLQAARKDGDSWIAKNIDRHISLWISRRLVELPLTPNQVTIVATSVGLLGVALIATAGYFPVLVGSALLVLSVIVDGCDGEVARTKFLESDFGRRLDFFLDNVVNVLAIFWVGTGYYFFSGETFYLNASIANACAAFAAIFPVYFLFFREKKEAFRASGEKVTDAFRIGELIAGRDFVYLILVLAIFGKAHWFTPICLMGIGVFLIFVCGLFFSRRIRAMSK